MNDIPRVCPICDELDSMQDHHPNLHVQTKYDESTFGVFVLQDPSAKFVFSNIDQWITKLLGNTAMLCFQEMADGDILIRGMYLTKNKGWFHWTKNSYPIFFIQILKNRELFDILLDPSITE